MFGSDSDLGQAYAAHQFLHEMCQSGAIEGVGQFTNSIHRNPLDVITRLASLLGKVDALIVGAGWANQLTGCVDAFLRNIFNDEHIVVFGVAIEDPKNTVHTQAAILSIMELPGAHVVYRDYVGENGCLRAAQDAVSGLYPVINRKTPKPPMSRSIHEAMEMIASGGA